MKSKVIAALAVIFIFSSCTYYEKGPVFSLKSAKSRIAGEWELSDVIVNDNTDEILLEEESEITLVFGEDGSLVIKNTGNKRSSPDVLNGTWEFNNEKTSVTMSIPEIYSYASILNYEMTIMRLTDDELWISDENSSERESEYITERRYKKISKL